MSPLTGILITIALLAANAFFVGAEFALISARRSIIEPRAQQGGRAARMTLWGIEHVSLMMATAQLGITVCSLALGYVAEPAIAHLLEEPFHAAGVPDVLVHPIAFAIALSLITYLHVVFGEMVPKNIALAGPERMAFLLGPVLVVVYTVFSPVLKMFNGIGNGVLRLMKVEPKDEVTSVFTRDEVSGLVEESRDGGLITAEDEQLLLNALTFQSRSVENIVLPMPTMRCLPYSFTAAQAEEVALAGFSRFPVLGPVDIDGDTGRPVGYVHVKDFLVIPDGQRDQPVSRDVIRTMPLVSSSDSLQKVLSTMQRAGAHLALVNDAQGELLGVATLEDVLEELVGQIRDDSRVARAVR
ncbi:hemolysin family protein [Jonesia quinghaiensis]|uniref:hemolysin family protein n=1 Tax=Jonesia quinghaiensis TaxID=262806 RepID=UPI00041BD32D|nr:hemolysin family protein [Jonesia quinghaiensis]